MRPVLRHNSTLNSYIPGCDADGVGFLSGDLTPGGLPQSRVLGDFPNDVIVTANRRRIAIHGAGRRIRRRRRQQILADGIEDGNVKMALAVKIQTQAQKAAKEEEDDAEPNGRQLTTTQLPLDAATAAADAAAVHRAMLLTRRQQRDGVQIAAGRRGEGRGASMMVVMMLLLRDGVDGGRLLLVAVVVDGVVTRIKL